MLSRLRGRQRSFTLLEVVVTVTVLAVVAGIGTSVVVQSARALAAVRDRTDAFADGEYALQRLALDLSCLADRSQITQMAAQSITITISGVPVRYELSGINLLRASKLLATNVASFNLTYYTASGALTSTASNLHRIGIEIIVTRNGSPAQLRTEVFPRTFRDSYIPTGGDGTDTGVNGRGGRRWWWFRRLWRWTRHRIW